MPMNTKNLWQIQAEAHEYKSQKYMYGVHVHIAHFQFASTRS